MRSIITSVLLVVFSTTVTLLIAEVAVRQFFPQQLIEFRQDIYIPMERFGFGLKANNDTVVNRGEGKVRLVTDDLGHRIQAGGRKTTASINILALGDSFLEALQVKYEQTMTALLENELAEKTGKTVSILNTGVSMYNPNHYLMLARKELSKRDFDLVVVFIYMANDVIDERISYYPPLAPTSKKALRIPKYFSKREIVDAILYPVNDFLEGKSHLFVLFKDRAKTLLARLGLTPYYFPSVMKKSMAQSDQWTLTAETLLDIEREASLHNAPVLFVLLPASYQVNTETFKWYLKSFNIDPATVDLDQPSRILTTELRKRNLRVLDTTQALRQAHADGIHDLYGETDPHFSPSGHRIVAAYLAPYIQAYLPSPDN